MIKNLKLKIKKLSKNVVLAIDPGYGRCGWAILEKNNKNKISLIACDVIVTNPGVNIPERLLELYEAIAYLIKKYKPNDLAIESLFWFKNKKTAINVAQARGVIIVAAKNNNLNVYEYTPLQVKQAVVGYGKATKQQVQVMIKHHLGKSCIINQDDTSDAVAIGLTHL
jgi:crossover junction endodeoxyribonuclease RuvC